MFSSGPIPAVDYFVVVSFCVEVVHTRLHPHPFDLDIGTLGREQTKQKLASTMKTKMQGFDQHSYFKSSTTQGGYSVNQTDIIGRLR